MIINGINWCWRNTDLIDQYKQYFKFRKTNIDEWTNFGKIMASTFTHSHLISLTQKQNGKKLNKILFKMFKIRKDISIIFLTQRYTCLGNWKEDKKIENAKKRTHWHWTISKRYHFWMRYILIVDFKVSYKLSKWPDEYQCKRCIKEHNKSKEKYMK